jgi:hypothetical protein
MDIGHEKYRDDFHKYILQLTDLIIELLNNLEKKGRQVVSLVLVNVGKKFLEGCDRDKVIETFISLSHQSFWEQIKNRDEEFFKKNAVVLFTKVPIGDTNPFECLSYKDEKGEYLVNKDDRESIWEYFDVLVKISILYIHHKRCPSIKLNDNGDKKPVYQKREFTEVKLEKHAKLWSVKLEFHSRTH